MRVRCGERLFRTPRIDSCGGFNTPTLASGLLIQSGYYEIGSVIALMIIAICAAVNIAYQLLERKYRCI